MKKTKNGFKEEIVIPNSVTCEMHDKRIVCKKGSETSERDTHIQDTKISVKDNKIIIECAKPNKKKVAAIRSFMAHIANSFNGLDKKFVYEMEICNVHFPMTVKVEGDKIIISNFLGEKEKRIANIIHGTHVEVKGQKIIVSSSEIEKAGQTAANIEQVTKISKRDRRVFQDGIFITSKCGVPI